MQVTGLTAERMQEIVDASIESGAVVGDDLILTRHDLTTINAGDVRGPQGIQGIPGVDGTTPGIQTGTYTPTLANMAIGTGGSAVNTASYCWLGGPSVGNIGQLIVHGRILFGTSGATLPGASVETISLPSGFLLSIGATNVPVGVAYLLDSGTNTIMGVLSQGSSAANVTIFAHNVTGAQVIALGLTSTSPFTWAVNDGIEWTLNCKAVRV